MPGKYDEKNLKQKYGKNYDPRLVDLVENMDKLSIGLDEEFEFGCRIFASDSFRHICRAYYISFFIPPDFCESQFYRTEITEIQTSRRNKSYCHYLT